MLSVPLKPCKSTGWPLGGRKGGLEQVLEVLGWFGLQQRKGGREKQKRKGRRERAEEKGLSCFVLFVLHVPGWPQLTQTPGLSHALGLTWKYGLGLFCLFLGRFFSFYPKPDAPSMPAPSAGEPVQWVNSSEEVFGHHGDLLQQNSPRVSSAKPLPRDHGTCAIPNPAQGKVTSLKQGLCAANPCCICNTSFGLYSNQWLAHKAPTNLFISYLLCK